jgi:hypothetical protein
MAEVAAPPLSLGNLSDAGAASAPVSDDDDGELVVSSRSRRKSEKDKIKSKSKSKRKKGEHHRPSHIVSIADDLPQREDLAAAPSAVVSSHLGSSAPRSPTAALTTATAQADAPSATLTPAVSDANTMYPSTASTAASTITSAASAATGLTAMAIGSSEAATGAPAPPAPLSPKEGVDLEKTMKLFYEACVKTDIEIAAVSFESVRSGQLTSILRRWLPMCTPEVVTGTQASIHCPNPLFV